MSKPLHPAARRVVAAALAIAALAATLTVLAFAERIHRSLRPGAPAARLDLADLVPAGRAAARAPVGPVLVLVGDPECPACARAESALASAGWPDSLGLATRHLSPGALPPEAARRLGDGPVPVWLLFDDAGREAWRRRGGAVDRALREAAVATVAGARAGGADAAVRADAASGERLARALDGLVVRALGGTLVDPAAGPRQRGPDDCGPAALAAALARRGDPIPDPGRTLAVPRRPGGTRLGDLAAAARRRGHPARAVRVPVDSLASLPVPAVLHVDGRHFVAWEGADSRGRLVVLDPALGRIAWSPAALRRRWSGVALRLDGPPLSLDRAPPARPPSGRPTDADEGGDDVDDDTPDDAGPAATPSAPARRPGAAPDFRPRPGRPRRRLQRALPRRGGHPRARGRRG